MWISDMPNVPPQDAPVMIAQANQAQAGDTTKMRTIGVCRPLPNHNYSLGNVVIPLTEAGYVGKDNATIQVDFGGVKVNVKYYFQALNQGLGNNWVGTYCSKTGPFWKISSTINGVTHQWGHTKITGSVQV